jgi:hypothetical protein
MARHNPLGQSIRSGPLETTTGRKGGKVFYGWWVVLASGVGLAVHFGPIIVATFGVFLKPLSQEFGWNRTQISLALSLATLGITVALPLVGRLVDRFGTRRVILLAVLLFGLSVLSLAFLSSHLWHFYAIYLLIGVVGSGTTPVPYAKVLSRWFNHRRGFLRTDCGRFRSERIAHAFLGTGSYRHGGLAPRLHAPEPHGHRSCCTGGRATAQGDTPDDGIGT